MQAFCRAYMWAFYRAVICGRLYVGCCIGGYIGAYISGCVRSVNVWTLGALPSMNDQQKPNTLDRKSTRLNSSHVSISYAVFCLKKKKQQSQMTLIRSRQ